MTGAEVVTISTTALAYTGTTTITSGGLTTSATQQISDLSDVTLGGTGVLTLGGPETINTLTGAAGSSIVNGGNLLTIDQDVAAIMAGVISGGGGLTLAAGSTAGQALSLNGINTYDGPTTVSGGTLLVNAVMNPANDGGFTVASGAVLGGTGTIRGDVTIQSGGILRPGLVGAVGTLTTLQGTDAASGDVTFQGTSILDIDLVGATSDLLAVGAGRTLTVPATALIQASGSATDGTTFTVVTAPIYDGTAFAETNLAANYTQTNTVNTSIKLLYTFILYPIPTLNEWGMIILLLSIVAAGLLVMRRRKYGSYVA